MSVATSLTLPEPAEISPLRTTLLELVEVISSVTRNEQETVATVVHMLTTGRVKLTGTFRDLSADSFID